jgi:hypothetical protein
MDVVADRPHHLDALPGRVVEFPVLVALAEEDRAGIAAAHRDDHIGGVGGVVVQLRRGAVRDIDAQPGHRRHRDRVHALGGVRAGRAHNQIVTAVAAGKPGRHLRTAGVVDTHERTLGVPRWPSPGLAPGRAVGPGAASVLSDIVTDPFGKYEWNWSGLSGR